MFNGLCADLNDISKLSFAKTRSVCPENFTGEKGKAGMAETGTGASCARDLGRGWKISPSVPVPAMLCRPPFWPLFCTERPPI